MPEYIRRQAQKKLYMFWGPMEEGWFSRFSEHTGLGLPLASDPTAPALTQDQLAALSKAITARKKQLASWYRRERLKMRSGKAGPGAKLSPLVKALANRKKPVGRRVHQPLEVFQKQHKEEIRAELTAHGHDTMNEAARVAAQGPDAPEETREEQELAVKLSRSERMQLRGKVVSKLWANASEEERQAVYREIAREKAALAKARRDAEEKDGTREKTTGEEYQEGVDGLDEMFEGAPALLGDSAGWVGVSLLAGPTPRMPGGEITVKVICSGETPAGNTFAESCIDFQKQIVEQFTQFAERVFSASTCRERAIIFPSEPAQAPLGPNTPPTVDVNVATPLPKPKRVPKPKKSKAPATSLPAPSVSTPVTSTPGGSPTLNTDPAFSFLTTSPGSLDRLGASLDEEFGAGFLNGLGMSAGLYDPGAAFGNSSFDDATPFDDSSSPGESSFGGKDSFGGGEDSFSGEDSFAGGDSFAAKSLFGGKTSFDSSSSFGGGSSLRDPFDAGGSRDTPTGGAGWGMFTVSSETSSAAAPSCPRPLPRPSYIGAPFYNAAEPVGARSIYTPGSLRAFSETPTPMIAAPASMRRKATAWASPTKSHGPTRAALALGSIIGAPATPAIPAAIPAIHAPAIPAATPAIHAPAIPAATSAIPAVTPAIPAATPAIHAPAIPGATPAIPAHAIPVVTPTFAFPMSRPVARIPVVKAVPALERKAPAKRGTEKALPATGTKRKAPDVEEEEEAVAPKRGPGRPPKPKPTAGEEGGALGDTTNANAAPIYSYSSSNDNRTRIAAEDLEKKRVAAEKAALRAENMRLHNPAGERPLVVVPVPRAVRERKAAKFLDGTLVLLKPKLTRAEAKQRKNAPSEKALLERAGRDVLAPAPPSKKRKTR
ncbi:hypothetical protein DFH09DRAFT_1339458 [Mycena vulgaris]|nr:hypothetical protein DFH09DRAFT_1339458 [Mycena vulgaris]